mgnify:FL=1
MLTPLNIRTFYVMLVVFLVSCGSKEDDQSANNTKTKTLSLKAAVPGTSQEIPAYDPDGGGWEVEKWNHKINKSLKELSSKLINDENWQIYADSMCNEFEVAIFHVPKIPKEITTGKIESFNDLEVQIRENSFSSGISTLLNTFSIFNNLERVSFKIINIDKIAKKNIQSDVIVHFAGAENNLDTELRGNIKMLWSNEKEDITLLSAKGDFSASLSSLGNFTDVTESTLGEVPEFKDQFYRGQDYWTSRIEMLTGIDVGGWQGVSVADVNGDGLDDFYIAQPGGLPNRLYIRNSKGGFEDWSKKSSINFLDSSHANLFFDIDNDGDQDLVSGVYEGIVIMENVGNGNFSKRASLLLPSAVPYSIVAADYDKDGDLDFYVCCYNRRMGSKEHHLFARPVPYHDANNGGQNVLFRNDENWSFKNVTLLEGLDQNNRKFSYAASWEDYDNDGDMDLYVANDFGRNNLYQNDSDKNEGTRFKDVSEDVGVVDVGPGMSVSWGDYDNDGFPDLYVANMFSSAGHRITSQDRFHKSADKDTREQYIRHARGNSLYRNLGNGHFEDRSVLSGISVGRWAWASRFEDIDGDGFQDVYVANGFITQEDTGDL